MYYVLNTAVITTPGTYNYRIITREQAVEWLRTRKWESRVGYPATAKHIELICDKYPNLSREQTIMNPGDEALVVRLKYRLNDPKQKKDYIPDFDDWEYGIIVKEG